MSSQMAMKRKARPLLARNLRYHRRQLRMTQKEVAAILRLSRSSYAYYETGATNPGYTTLLQLAELYGTTAHALLTEDAAKTSKNE